MCAFSDKAQRALDAGAAGIIVYNSAPFGDQISIMGGLAPVNIPAVFVSGGPMEAGKVIEALHGASRGSKRSSRST